MISIWRGQCLEQPHEVFLTDSGKLYFPNHSKKELQAELVIKSMKGSICTCAEVLIAWRSSFKFFKFEVDSHIKRIISPHIPQNVGDMPDERLWKIYRQFIKVRQQNKLQDKILRANTLKQHVEHVAEEIRNQSDIDAKVVNVSRTMSGIFPESIKNPLLNAAAWSNTCSCRSYYHALDIIQLKLYSTQPTNLRATTTILFGKVQCIRCFKDYYLAVYHDGNCELARIRPQLNTPVNVSTSAVFCRAIHTFKRYKTIFNKNDSTTALGMKSKFGEHFKRIISKHNKAMVITIGHKIHGSGSNRIVRVSISDKNIKDDYELNRLLVRITNAIAAMD